VTDPWLIGVDTRVMLKGRFVLLLTVVETGLKGDGTLSLVLVINDYNDTIPGSYS